MDKGLKQESSSDQRRLGELEKPSWKITFVTEPKEYSKEQYKLKEAEKLWVRFTPICLEVKEKKVVGSR
jgi:hypothetical protein